MDLAGWFQMGQTPAHQWDRLRRLTDSEVSVCFRDFSRLPRSFSWVFFSSGPYKHKLIQRLSKVSCHQYYSIWCRKAGDLLCIRPTKIQVVPKKRKVSTKVILSNIRPLIATYKTLRNRKRSPSALTLQQWDFSLLFPVNFILNTAKNWPSMRMSRREWGVFMPINDFPEAALLLFPHLGCRTRSVTWEHPSFESGRLPGCPSLPAAASSAAPPGRGRWGQ